MRALQPSAAGGVDLNGPRFSALKPIAGFYDVHKIICPRILLTNREPAHYRCLHEANLSFDKPLQRRFDRSLRALKQLKRKKESQLFLAAFAVSTPIAAVK